MHLFSKEDIVCVANDCVTKSKELLLNMVANKAASINLTSSYIYGQNNKDRMFYIQGEIRRFFRDNPEGDIKRWILWLNKICETKYGISLEDVCTQLGGILYNWLSDPRGLPDATTVRNNKRMGVDDEDRSIISNSVEKYNVKIEDCIKWICDLIIKRNYEGGLAEKSAIELLQNYLNIRYKAMFRVAYGKDNDDRSGIDVVIQSHNCNLKLQIKRISYVKYKSIKDSYDSSYSKEENRIDGYLIYDKNDGKIHILNLNKIYELVNKKCFK